MCINIVCNNLASLTFIYILSFDNIYSCALSQLDVDPSMTMLCVMHSMLIGIITPRNVMLFSNLK